MSDSPEPEIPTFAELAADPEIAPLLEFEPVHRKLKKTDGWTPAMQRMYVGWLAYYGFPGKAADELGKARSGIDKVYKAAGADSFRAACDGAVALAERRRMERLASASSGAGAMTPPSLYHRRKTPSPPEGEGSGEGLPGEILNEFGEYEDEASYARRGDDALDSIRDKLLRCRRLFLQEIAASPGKRAAFEILTELPIDWDKAAKLEPQPDEPWNRASQRQPDMILTAESGWMLGEHG